MLSGLPRWANVCRPFMKTGRNGICAFGSATSISKLSLIHILHLIPQQVINAFMVGLVLGYIYYRTGSLLPVILIHCINNAISYFSWMLGGGKILSTREQLGNETLYYIVYGVACVLFIAGFVSIGLRISREEKRARLEAATSQPDGETASGDKISDEAHTNQPD